MVMKKVQYIITFLLLCYTINLQAQKKSYSNMIENWYTLSQQLKKQTIIQIDTIFGLESLIDSTTSEVRGVIWAKDVYYKYLKKNEKDSLELLKGKNYFSLNTMYHIEQWNIDSLKSNNNSHQYGMMLILNKSTHQLKITSFKHE